jgi:chemotaxis protein CheD
MNRPPMSWKHSGLGLPQVYLLPGELHCSAEPSMVRTVLGSCVAVCLWDRMRGLSGINHFVLPRSNREASLRYGDVAIERLIIAMHGLNCRTEHVEAKLFGGAAVLSTNSAEYNVGTRNVEVAVAHMNALGIPIVAQHTGGKSGLAIRLLTASGEVLVRRVSSSIARQADEATPNAIVHNARSGGRGDPFQA